MPKGVYKHKIGIYKHSKLVRKIISDSKIGKNLSESHKSNISLSHKGKHIGENNNGWKGGKIDYLKKNAPRLKPKTCEICGRIGKICFDHCHKSGKFRGWICLQCNVALGLVNDNPEILKSMIKYLKNL